MPSTKPTAAGPTPEPAAAVAATVLERGDERIGAVIDVQHHRLRALEQDALAGAARLRPAAPTPVRRRAGCAAPAPSAASSSACLSNVGAPRPASSVLWCSSSSSSLRRHRFGFGQVGDADGAAGHLVLVGRADAAAGGADLAVAARRLARPVERRRAAAGSAWRSRRCAAFPGVTRQALRRAPARSRPAAPRGRPPRRCR